MVMSSCCIIREFGGRILHKGLFGMCWPVRTFLRRLSIEIICDLYMVGETVRLDHRHFVDCTFLNCVLEYGGEEVILERTAIRNCRHSFHGPAFLTLRLLQAVGIVQEEIVIPAELAALVQ